jgi:flagellar basal-body rod modification protein FlgD
MAIDAAAATQAAAASGVTGIGRQRLAENFDTFLSLLTTQLKNQDPLSPLDSNQFTQQLVQMTGVEQQLLTNDMLEKLVANTSNGISTAVSLIGKQVRAVSADAALAGGKAEWTYSLDRAAADVKVEVLDAKGKIVHAFAPTENGAGEHKFTWDGKDLGGSKLADGGIYTLRVTAKDSEAATVPSTIFANGVVNGVEQVDGQTLITINGAKVAWEKVTSVAQAPVAPTTPTPPAG